MRCEALNLKLRRTLELCAVDKFVLWITHAVDGQRGRHGAHCGQGVSPRHAPRAPRQAAGPRGSAWLRSRRQAPPPLTSVARRSRLKASGRRASRRIDSGFQPGSNKGDPEERTSESHQHSCDCWWRIDQLLSCPKCHTRLFAQIVGQPGRVRVCPAQGGTDVERIAAPQASHHAIKAQIETDRPASMKAPPGTGRPTQRPTHTPAQSGELCCQLDHTIRILPAFWIAHGRCSVSGNAIQRVSRRLDSVAKCRVVWLQSRA